MNFINYITEKYSNSEKRSKETMKNISISLLMRATNIISQILIVNLTISYLNAERYGIWLALSGIIGWISFFDLGLSIGFKNRFTEARAHGNKTLAKQYVSTTYCVISVIVLCAMLIAISLNCTILDWPAILNVNTHYKDELSFVFNIVIVFTCINMIANIFSSLLVADQKAGYASVIQAGGQVLSLISIFILLNVSKGSLINLALYYSGIPCTLLIVVSCILFKFSRYKEYKPSFKCIRFGLTKDIMNLGMEFFSIQLCMLAIFQIVNIIISRELGPEAVAEYNITNKYFNIVYMTMTIILTPLWSAFTDAYAKEDYVWMRSIFNKLIKSLMLISIIFMVMQFVSPWIYTIWIGENLQINTYTSISMAVFAMAQTYSVINCYIVNGLGKVRIQMYIFIIFALISWWIMTKSCEYGLSGIILYTACIYLIIGLLCHFQIKMILNKKAKGIWAQ